jgi:hypothetical protein
MATLDELTNIKMDIKAIFSLSVYGLRQQSRMMKLGDVVDNIFRGKPLKPEEKTGSLYPYFGSNGIINYIDKYMCDDNYILVGRMGSAGKIHTFSGKFYPSEMVLCMKPKSESVIFKYLEYYLKICADFVSMIKFQAIPGITKKDLDNLQIPVPSLHIQQQIINKINLLNTQSSHYETYAQTLQQEIDHIMETINNMCSNSANSTDTNTTNKLSNKAKQILNDLGLEDVPDIEQLLSDVNAELESGYELLNRLNKSDFANIETETETETDFETELNFDPEEDILAKVSKAKTSNKKSKQMYTNI